MKDLKLNISAVFKKPASLREAVEKRDSAKLLALGCLAFAILCTVLGAAMGVDIVESLGMLAIVAAVVFFVIWYSSKKVVFKFQNIYCECGARFIFPNNVVYEKKGEQLSSGKNSDGKGVTSHISTTVTPLCTCPKCGKVHAFDSTFVTERKVYNERGVLMTEKAFPLDQQLAEFFNK